MRKLEIQAYSIEEAKLKAFEEGITIVNDLTLHWRKSGSPILTKELNIFAADYLEKKGMFSFKDAGIIIAVHPGIEDTRKNPFKIQNYVRKGRCKVKRVVEIRTQKDDNLIGSASTKREAVNLAKELIKKYQEDLYAKTRYVSSDIDFTMKYKPSVRSRLGQYIVFAVDESDVRISKRRSRGFE